MNTPQVIQGTPSTHGDVLTAISDGMVALLKEFYGRGPTRAKSYYQDDLVVCVLRGGFSRVEETLLEGGRGPAVIQQRMEFQEVMRERFTEVIEQATGRAVIGFMSGNQQHPDLMCEVFILAPTDLVERARDPCPRAVPVGILMLGRCQTLAGGPMPMLYPRSKLAKDANIAPASAQSGEDALRQHEAAMQRHTLGERAVVDAGPS